ncbi:MAG: SsrA-binding protein SmpB [Thermoleophilia bacterium]|nr:SsrA-binding protein SmpB [Thermoleophilia bacterium]
MAAAKRQQGDGRKIVAENPKARHDFFIIEELEAGLALTGTEVKSLRAGKAAIREAYVRIDDGEAFVYGMNISTYEQGNVFNHEPARTRKLLLHRREIDDLHVHTTRKGHTIVPLALYFRDGRAKLSIGVAKGKDRGDKRQTIAKRDVQRQIDRELKDRR